MKMFKVTFSLLSNYNQSACCTLDRVLNGQSDFDLVLYKHHREFPLHKQVILMLKCPIVPLSGQLLNICKSFLYQNTGIQWAGVGPGGPCCEMLYSLQLFINCIHWKIGLDWHQNPDYTHCAIQIPILTSCAWSKKSYGNISRKINAAIGYSVDRTKILRVDLTIIS